MTDFFFRKNLHMWKIFSTFAVANLNQTKDYENISIQA